jgi:DNA uptake protein ComE-like DNA-binding protein
MQENVKGVVNDMGFSRAKILQEIEVGASVSVQRHQFSINYGAVRQTIQRLRNIGKPLIQDILAARKESGFGSTANGFKPIAV